MKTISATATGIVITYENTGNTLFVKYGESDFQDKPSRSERPRLKDIQNYNPVQQNMLNRIMKGVSFYSEKELSELPKNIVKSIASDHEKASFLLRKLKVNTYYHAENKLLNAIFPNVKLGDKIMDYYIGCNQVVALSFIELGIGMEAVVSNLIRNRFLPKNFNDLSLQELSKSL